VAITLIRNASFVESFYGQQSKDLYLVNHSGEVLLSPPAPAYPLNSTRLKAAFEHTLKALKSSTGVQEYKDPLDVRWLLAMARVGSTQLSTAALVKKDHALSAAHLLMVKSLVFLLLLICITIVLSILVANRLTSALSRLSEATKKVSSGDFEIKVDIQSRDEIEDLGQSFNLMTGEIKRLMGQVAEKARMEGELKTAKLVQSRLFPEESFTNDKIQINGFYEPASECGGDWWFYNIIENKVYLWIGDATGHGVPAALVTSAARSASSILENFPNLDILELICLLNKSIFHSAKGQVLMTFFLGCLDLNTGQLTYCNASHDPPFLIPKKDEALLKKNSISPLLDSRSPRLGESLDSQFKCSTVQLKELDKLIFYTDGVTELKNIAGEMLGERRMIRSLLKTLNQEDNVAAALKNLIADVNEFKGDCALEDDVTCFMLQYKNSA
jgi:sigma-B regulation protein RsbU (phosphoserine phosphatase)